MPDPKYFEILRELWSSDVERRLAAVSEIRFYDKFAVGPLTRRLIDRSPDVVARSHESLTELGFRTTTEYFLRMCADPAEQSVFEFSAAMTAALASDEDRLLHHAAILAAISGVRSCVPNVCVALSRARDPFAIRALSESLFRLHDSRHASTFRSLAMSRDPIVATFGIYGLASVGDVDLLLDVLDRVAGQWLTSKRSDAATAADAVRRCAEWIGGGTAPAWHDRYRWPDHAHESCAFRDRIETVGLLDWTTDDLPVVALEDSRVRSRSRSASSRESFGGIAGAVSHQIWCDGSWYDESRGGWGAVLVWPGGVEEWAAPVSCEANSAAEIRAAIEGVRRSVERLPPVELTVVSDWAAISECMCYRADRWYRTSWLRNSGGTIRFGEMWRELLDVVNDAHTRGFRFDWKWTKAHSGHRWNERADEIARRAALGQ